LVEIVGPTLVLLDPLVVGESDPDHLVPTLNNPCFNLQSDGWNVLFCFHMDLAHDGLSLLESPLVKSDPNLAFWMSKMTQ